MGGPSAPRVWMSPQAGRGEHRNVGEAEQGPWSTTSGSMLRGFDASEMRTCKSSPIHVKPALEPAVLHSSPGRQRNAAGWRRHRDHFPDHSEWMEKEGGPLPPSDFAQHRALPDEPFDGRTAYRDDQKRARLARQRHFPGRDESLGDLSLLHRAKSMSDLALLAHSKAVDTRRLASRAGSVGSTAVSASTQRTEGGRTWVTNGYANGVNVNNLRSVSEASCVTGSSAPSRYSADSRLIPGGIARRRMEMNLRCPAQEDRDREWLEELWERDGPAGLTSANYASAQIRSTMSQEAHRLKHLQPLMAGSRDGGTICHKVTNVDHLFPVKLDRIQ